MGALIDSLYVGYKGISLSDTLYYGEQEEETLFTKITNTLLIVSILSLLIVGPRLLIDLLDLTQTMKGFTEGILRGLIVITYIYLVGKTKDAQELFEYHGAEHMTIASFEAEHSLEIDGQYQKISKRTYSLWNCFYIFNSFCKFANASIHSYPQYIFYTNFSAVLHVFCSRYDFIRNFEI